MKTKNGFEKKLVLKRRTIIDLDTRELNRIVGGTGLSCNCNTDYCTVHHSMCPACNTDGCY